MTAAATTPRRTTVGSAHAFVGTGALVRFLLRRDRIKLPAWTAGFGLFVVYLVTALPAAYGTEEDLAGIAQIFDQPVARALVGPGYGFDAPTIERFIANGYGLYFFLLAALMSILLVTRHTRVEEQTGRAELIRASVVGSHASLTAALIVAALTSVVAAAVVFLLMVGVGGYAAAGSALFAAAIAAVGLAFAGVTALTVQLTEFSRASAGLAGIVVGVAFVLRAGGDIAAPGGGTLSWLSPLGWGQQTAPFVLDRWWPLALLLGLGMVSAAAGYALRARRDLGAGLLAVRTGRARAIPALGTPFGLALRLQRASIIGWALAVGVGGLAYGAYTDALMAAIGDLPEAFLEIFGGAEDVLAGYLAYIATFMAYVVGVYAILVVSGLRTEETSGRAEPLLATPVSRSTWLGANLAVAAGGIFVIMLATGAASGLGAGMVTGDWGHVGDLTLAHLNHVPAVFVVLGVAALLFGILPRAIPATWAVVAYAVFVGTFGAMLDLPEAAFGVSPFEHAAQLPLETFVAAPLVVLTLIAGILAALGVLALRRRDLDVN